MGVIPAAVCDAGRPIWPFSRESMPEQKQLIPCVEGRPTVQQDVDRDAGNPMAPKSGYGRHVSASARLVQRHNPRALAMVLAADPVVRKSAAFLNKRRLQRPPRDAL